MASKVAESDPGMPFQPTLGITISIAIAFVAAAKLE